MNLILAWADYGHPSVKKDEVFKEDCCPTWLKQCGTSAFKRVPALSFQFKFLAIPTDECIA